MKRTLSYILLSAALLAAVTGLSAASRRAAEAEKRLTEVYAGALYESMEDVQALSLSLEKLLVSSDPAQCAELLCSISGTADNVRRGLTVLPLSHEAMDDTLAYVNRLAEYTLSLAGEIARDGTLNDSAMQTLNEHRSACTRLSAHLALANQEMATSAGKPQLMQAFGMGASAAERPLESIGSPSDGMQYPDYAYDGAFSPSHKRQPRGLQGDMITADEALAIARNFIGVENVVSVRAAPNTGGAIPAYGVTVMTNDLQLNVDVTAQGGRILWMMPEAAAFTQLLDADACAQLAADFLQAHGFGPMELIGREIYNGLCVLSYAAVQDGVVLYPDTIRVQVRMDQGDIVGFEAYDYWMNHELRSLISPALAEADARALLSSQVTAESGRLCIIPQHTGEQLCWEFPVRYGDAQYLIYLDADDGSEAEVKKLIPTETGITTA